MNQDQFEELIDTLVGIRQELSSIDDSICHAHREGLNFTTYYRFWYAYGRIGQLGKCNNTPHRGIFMCIIEMEKTTRLTSRFVFSHPITFDNEEKVS